MNLHEIMIDMDEYEDDDSFEGEDFSNFKCKSCGVNTLDIGEYYMVADQVWSEACAGDNDEQGMLCIGCLEARLDRTLDSWDFTNCPLNFRNVLNGSMRIVSRLTSAHHQSDDYRWIDEPA